MELFNERQAHISLVQDIQQNKQRELKAKNMETIKEEKQRKHDNNMRFWHSIKQVVFAIVCAAIAVYTLIHFAQEQIVSTTERYFAQLSSYGNTNKGMSMSAQEEWLDQFPQKRAENKPNGGIIRSVADTSRLDLREMSPRERKVARAKAQREHREALKNLAKQEVQDAKKIAKQLVVWKREQRKEENKTEMGSSTGQVVLDDLKANGVYVIADSKLNRKYIQKIITKARGLGYQIGAVRDSRTITAYKLIGNKKP